MVYFFIFILMALPAAHGLFIAADYGARPPGVVQ